MPGNSGLDQQLDQAKRRRWWHLCLIAGMALLVYCNGLQNGFVGDDNGFVKDNITIRSLKNIPSFFSDPKSLAANDPDWGTFIYRPLRTTSYAVDYFLFGGNSTGYHAVNLVLHIAVCIALYFIIELLFHQSITSLVGALLFAVHPVHVEAVSWIASRADLLGALFAFLSLLCYLLYHERRTAVLLAGSLLFSVLAYLGKETTVFLPGIIMLYDLVADREKTLKEHVRSHGTAWVLFTLLCLLYLVLRYSITGRMSTVQGWWGGTPYSNFLMMTKATALYLKLLVLPFSFSLHYIIEPVSTLFDAKTALSLAMIVSTLALTIYYYFRNRLIFFCLAFFYLALVPIANIIPISFSMMAERYIYLPSAGPIVAAAYGISYLYERSKPVKTLYLACIASGILLVLAFSSLVIMRNTVYKDDLTFYTAAVRESPGSAPSYKGLADQYAKNGDEKNALENYEKALKLDPYYPEALINLALVHGKLKNPEKALLEARSAVEQKPTKPELRYLYGNILKNSGDMQGAVTQWQKVIELDPYYSEALNSLGNYYFIYEKNLSKAAEMYARSCASDPENAEAFYNRALIDEIRGDTANAKLHFRQFVMVAGPEYHDVVEAVKHRYPD
jgi:protein O-mannosyl-transferase